jgi:adenosylcobinamide-phosphate synthase
MFFLSAWLLSAVLLLALLIDRWLGEPPARIHPVVGMGHYLNAVGVYAAPLVTSLSSSLNSEQNRTQQRRSFFLGAGFWLCGALLVTALAFATQSALTVALLRFLPTTAAPYAWTGLAALAALALVLVFALLLKPLFAWRMLADEVQAVESALAQSLDAGRARLAYLVSRDTRNLSASEVREAAIETLAENFNDSVIAPLFWFCIGGLPAAALYRYANTADASWGYIGERGGRDWTDAGRFAARADDVLSWLPARLTALIIFIAAQAGFTPKKPENTLKNTLENLRAEAGKTPSPNSGWPMAALALALNVHLCKAGVYSLNPKGQSCDAQTMAQALRLMRRCWRGLLLGSMLFGALACWVLWAEVGPATIHQLS